MNPSHVHADDSPDPTRTDGRVIADHESDPHVPDADGAKTQPVPKEQGTPPSTTDSGTAPVEREETSPALLDRVAELEAALQKAQEDCLRARAELENFRKRVRREMDEERQYAGLPLISDLLPVVDNLARAVEAAENNPGDGTGLLEGVRMVKSQLLAALEKHGCRLIDAQGHPFDPMYHAAIGQVPTKDQAPGTVVQVAVAGFQLHDRVVRPSQVLVAAAPVSTDQAPAESDPKAPS